MSFHPIRSLTLLALGFAVLPSPAAQPKGPRFTLALGLAQPMGDLRNDLQDQPGMVVSFMAPFLFEGGHAIRPRLDVIGLTRSEVAPPATLLPDGTLLTPVAQAPREYSRGSFGVDYVFHPSGTCGKGPYLFLGAGIGRWGGRDGDDRERRDTLVIQTRPGTVQPLLRDHQSLPGSGSLQVQGGVGWRLGRWFGLEAQVTRSSYRKDELAPTAQDPMAFRRLSRTATVAHLGATFNW